MPYRRPLMVFLIALALSGGAMFSTRALAQTDRAQSIRILVGFAPGGGLDLFARLFAQKIGSQLSIPVVVENIVGANGNIAASTVARGAPDGRTLLFVSSVHVMNAAIDPRIPYDPIKDFAPVSVVSNGANVILVPPSLGVTTLQQFLDLARQKPGTLFFSSAGVGTVSHMPAELLKAAAKIDITHVPYKGGAPGLAAVMSGEVQLNVAGTATAMSYIRSGKLLPLAVTSLQRVRALPNVPTADSAGVPGYDFTMWNGFIASAQTPAEVVQRLHGHIVAALAAPDLLKRIEDDGYTAVGNTPKEFAALLRSELEKWTRIVKTAKLSSTQ